MYVAIVTNTSTVEAVIDFASKAPKMYLAIGKTSPWEIENNPPVETPETKTLTETIGYKQVSRVLPCKEVNEGEKTTYPTVTEGSKTYALIPVEKAFEEVADKVLIETLLSPEDLPTGPYRQVGLFIGLVAKEGYKTRPSLLPSQVETEGNLYMYENREMYNRTDKAKFTETFIVSFVNTKTV